MKPRTWNFKAERKAEYDQARAQYEQYLRDKAAYDQYLLDRAEHDGTTPEAPPTMGLTCSIRGSSRRRRN